MVLIVNIHSGYEGFLPIVKAATVKAATVKTATMKMAEAMVTC